MIVYVCVFVYEDFMCVCMGVIVKIEKLYLKMNNKIF